MKVCCRCKESKEESLFGKCSSSKDGLKSSCKSCRNIDAIVYRKSDIGKKTYIKYKDLNKDRIENYKKEWYIENKEDILTNSKENYKKNKEIINKRSRDYVNNNKEVISEYQKSYYNKNKNIIREYKRVYSSERSKTDLLFKLKNNISSLIRVSMKKVGFKKHSKSIDILGCNIEEFRLYIESKFEPWMNWDNHGKYNGEYSSGWDIDHIIPISTSKNEDEIVVLNHYTNLRPLCSRVNRNDKRNKLNY